MSNTAKRSNSSGFLALLSAGPQAAPLVDARQALHLGLLISEALAEVTAEADGAATAPTESPDANGVTVFSVTSLLGR